MAQRILAFKYESEKNNGTDGAGRIAGVSVYQVIGLTKSMKKNLKGRTDGQGWTDSQI
jgi:hypothetical protein